MSVVSPSVRWCVMRCPRRVCPITPSTLKAPIASRAPVGIAARNAAGEGWLVVVVLVLVLVLVIVPGLLLALLLQVELMSVPIVLVVALRLALVVAIALVLIRELVTVTATIHTSNSTMSSTSTGAVTTNTRCVRSKFARHRAILDECGHYFVNFGRNLAEFGPSLTKRA